MSGVLVGAPASLELHKPLVVLRKKDDVHNHSFGSKFIGSSSMRGRYLIIDDLIASGATYHRIRSEVERVKRFSDSFYFDRPPEVSYAGAYMYASHYLSWAGDSTIFYDPDSCGTKAWVNEDGGR